MSERLRVVAEQLLADEPSSVRDLAKALFNVTGPLDPWVPLVERLLRDDERFVLGEDGRWRLRSVPAPTNPVLLAGRRTRARGGHLRSLAITELETGKVRRWQLLPPGSKQTEGDRSQDEDAVLLADVAAEVAAAVDGRPLVVLDSLLVTVLLQELERAGSPVRTGPVALLDPAMWTQAGGKQWLQDARRALGLVPQTGDELPDELELMQVLLQKGGAENTVPSGGEDGSRMRLRRLALSAPEEPGVYAFVDAAGGLLYVGSASNLRRRLLSYFGSQIEHSRGLRGLLERSEAIRIDRLGTHLEAVIEETRLIADARPPYNVQRQITATAAWLVLTDREGRLTVRVSAKPGSDAEAIVGPFATRAAAERLAGVAAELFGFRRHTKRHPTPGVGAVSADTFARLVRDPEAFAAAARQRLSSRLASLAPREVAKLRQALIEAEAAAQGLCEDVSLLGDALVLRESETAALLQILLVRGTVPVACAVCRPDSESSLTEALTQLNSAATPGAKQDIEPRIQEVVRRWLFAHRNDPGVVAIGTHSVDDLLAEVQARLERMRADPVDASGDID